MLVALSGVQNYSPLAEDSLRLYVHVCYLFFVAGQGKVHQQPLRPRRRILFLQARTPGVFEGRYRRSLGQPGGKTDSQRHQTMERI